MFIYSFIIGGFCALSTFFCLIWSLKAFPDGYSGFNMTMIAVAVAVVASNFNKGFSSNHYKEKVLNVTLMRMSGCHSHLIQSYQNTLNNSIKNSCYAAYMFGVIYFLDTGDLTASVISVFAVSIVIALINLIGLPYATDKKYLYPYFKEASWRVFLETYLISASSVLLTTIAFKNMFSPTPLNIFFVKMF